MSEQILPQHIRESFVDRASKYATDKEYQDSDNNWNSFFVAYFAGLESEHLRLLDTLAPLTYTPAQVIEMVTKAFLYGGDGNKTAEDIKREYTELLTTLGLSVPGDKM